MKYGEEWRQIVQEAKAHRGEGRSTEINPTHRAFNVSDIS
jgi:hypothetical protein